MNCGKNGVFGNFNSHAHVERDETARQQAYSLSISTHTLTWSVTLTHLLEYGHAMISTHTLTWSVTAMRCKVLAYAEISTHTLTWSVTTA